MANAFSGANRMGSFPVFRTETKSEDKKVSVTARPTYYQGVKLRPEDIDVKETALQRQARKRIERAQEHYDKYGEQIGVGQRIGNRFLDLIGISTDIAFSPLEIETLPSDSYVDISDDGDIREMLATQEQLRLAMRNKSLEQAATLMKGAMNGRVKSASQTIISEMQQKVVKGAAKMVVDQAAKKAATVAASAALGAATGGTSVAVQMAASFVVDKAGKALSDLGDSAKPLIAAAVGGVSFALIQIGKFLASLGPLGGLLTSAGFGTGFMAGFAASGGNIVFALGTGVAGGIGGAVLAASGVTLSAIGSGAMSFIGAFTGGGALVTLSTPWLLTIGVGLGAVTLVTGAIYAQFEASPPKGENEGPPTLFTVEKSAQPSSIENLGNGFVANYSLTITPKNNRSVKIDSIIDETVAYTKSGPVTLSKKSIGVIDGQTTYTYYVNITAQGLKNVNIIQNGVSKNAFTLLEVAKDFNVINTVTVVGLDESGKSQNQVAEAVIKVGNPIDEAPYDYPVQGVIKSIDNQDIDVNGVVRPHCGTVFFPSRECLQGGLDISGNPNASVKSTLDGIVKVSTYDADSTYGLGGVVYVVSMTGEYKAIFLHLNDSGLPKVNSVIKRGDVVGSVYSGILKTTTGSHVHYQVLRGGANWNFVNHVGPCGNGNLLPTAPVFNKSVFPTTFPPASLVCDDSPGL